MKLLLSFFVLMTLALPASAAEVGQSIPHDLKLQNQNGAVQNFDTFSGENGAVLIFTRSVDWCPYCKLQMTDLNKDIPKFKKAGYTVIGISPDDVGDLARFDEKLTQTTGWSQITFLSDGNSDAIRAFNVLNTDVHPNHSSYGIPNPTIFVVGKDKVIQAKLQEEGYKTRPQIADILKAIAAQ